VTKENAIDYVGRSKRKGNPMKTSVLILLLFTLSALAIAAPQLGTLRQPTWAFQVIDPAAPPQPEDTGPVRIPEAQKVTLGQKSKTWQRLRTGSRKRMGQNLMW
jgi:hypothetical protein